MQPSSAITRFEIPAVDLDRAVRFYEAVLDRTLKHERMAPHQLAVFPYDAPGVGGCLIAGAEYAPGAAANLVDLNAGPRLDDALQRVPRAGGRIALPKTPLPEGMGAFAHIIDSEGNRVGLHALAEVGNRQR